MAKTLTPARKNALHEEAEEWDAMSDQECEHLFDKGTPVRTHLRRPPPKTLTVTLDQPTLNHLKRIARRKQVSPRQLAAMWIADRLKAPEGSRRA